MTPAWIVCPLIHIRPAFPVVSVVVYLMNKHLPMQLQGFIAAGGLTALHLLATPGYDVIVLDLMLPEFSQPRSSH